MMQEVFLKNWKKRLYGFYIWPWISSESSPLFDKSINQMYSTTASRFHSPYNYLFHHASRAPEILSIGQFIPALTPDNMPRLPIFYFPPIIASQLIQDPALKFHLISVSYTQPGTKYFGLVSMVRDSEVWRFMQKVYWEVVSARGL